MKKFTLSIILATLVLSICGCSDKGKEIGSLKVHQEANSVDEEYVLDSENEVNEEIIVAEQSDIIDEEIQYNDYNGWYYGVIEDGIRGSRKYAVINSINSHDVGNGESQMKITIRQKTPGKEYYDILLEADGIFFCTSSNCSVNMRMDDEIRTYYYSNESTGKMNIVFIQSYTDMINNLTGKKELVIEAPFLNFGRKQFVFNTEGFDIQNQ